MRCNATIGGLLGVLIFAACVHADEAPPPRKPGLWEMTMTPDAGATKTMRLCLDESFEKQLMSKGADKADACSRHDTHRQGGAFVMNSVCLIMGSQQTAHSVTTFDGDSAYTTVIEANFDPPFLGKTGTKLAQTGKWLGECGPDLKPGDMVVNGVKVEAPARP